MLCKVRGLKNEKYVKFGVAEADGVFLVSAHTRNLKLNFNKPMANVFGILTAIVLALSAFVAFKNKSRYEIQVGTTEEKKTELAKVQKRLEVAKKGLEGLPVEQSGISGEVDSLTAEETKQKKANEAIKAQTEAKTKKIAANKEQLDDIRSKTEKVGDLKELSSKMRATNAELAELTDSITATEAKLAGLSNQAASAQAQIESANQKAADYTNGQSLAGLSTRIRSIYPNWGFVTLAAGNSSGVVNNSTLNVIRNGETIANLVVTAVESNTSSATIVPDSLGENVTLRVGDRVVPGVKATKPAK